MYIYVCVCVCVIDSLFCTAETNTTYAIFPCGSAGEESACNVGDVRSIPGVGRSPGEGKGYLPTSVFWPGEFLGLYRPWSSKESDMTDQLSLLS